MLELFLTDYTLRIVSIGAMILGIVSGVLGTFSVLRKQSLIGDAVSHSALPGIAIAFILIKAKNTEVLLLGALISGLLAVFFINAIERNSKIKFDSALALILSVFFGVGLMLLTYIQKMPNANQAGLEKFIFGQASTLLIKDVKIMGVVALVAVIMVIVIWKELKVFSFDPEYTKTLGFSTKLISYLMSALIVLAIIVGLQTVGVILMSAMLIAPAVAARQWTDKLSVMVLLSAFFGGISGVIGTLISSSMSKMPTGPVIVSVVSLIVFISILIAPNRGIIWRKIKEKSNMRNINEEKVLINLYYLSRNHENPYHKHNIRMVKPIKSLDGKAERNLELILNALKEKGLAESDYFDSWSITKVGIEKVSEIQSRRGGK